MAQPIDERILYEDNHLLVVNKLAGELAQGDKTGDASLVDLVKDYIKRTYNKPGEVFVGLVHRIDRPVSGAIIFAKTSKALSRMTVLVKNRDFEKQYLAVVKNPPPLEADSLIHFLVKNERQNKSFVVAASHKGAKEARLDYQLLKRSERFFMLRVDLHTGRHHQIRVQLAAMGCPIKGDLKYGSDRSNPDGSISLHAFRIAFEHPVKKEKIEIIAQPADILPWNLFID